MSVQSQVSSISYNGNGATLIFNYPFRILNGSDIGITITDSTTGVVTIPVLNTDYTVTNVNNINGGTIVFSVAPTSTQVIFIGRTNQQYLQPMTFLNNQAFDLITLEQDLDGFALADQQLALKITLINQGNTSISIFKNMSSTSLSGILRIFASTAIPTTGTFNQGDKVINQSPTVGLPKGWICTVSGTPGTWVSEGNL